MEGVCYYSNFCSHKYMRYTEEIPMIIQRRYTWVISLIYQIVMLQKSAFENL
jgi:hypothetical protein